MESFDAQCGKREKWKIKNLKVRKNLKNWKILKKWKAEEKEKQSSRGLGIIWLSNTESKPKVQDQRELQKNL